MLVTCGPWRPVRLECYRARIVDLYPQLYFDDGMQNVTVQIDFDIEGTVREAAHAVFDILDSVDGTVIAKGEQLCDKNHCRIQCTLEIAKIKLWWPNGWGDQPLYTVKVELLDEVRPSRTESAS